MLVTERIHFIVAKSRNGWAVNVESDFLSEHQHAEGARDEAAMLADAAAREGALASLVDLSGRED
jgi:hypothetical protein